MKKKLKQLVQIISNCEQCFFKNSLSFNDGSLSIKNGLTITRSCNHPNLPVEFKKRKLNKNSIPKFCPLEDYIENKK